MSQTDCETVDWLAHACAANSVRDTLQSEIRGVMHDAAMAALEAAGYMPAFTRSDISFGGAIRLQLWRRTGRLVTDRLGEAVALVERGATPTEAATVIGAATIGRELVDEMIELHMRNAAAEPQTARGMAP